MSLPPPTDNYIGEPQYPAPWTTKKPREGLRDSDAAVIVSLAPDVCKSPSVPIPYPIVDFCGHDENYTKSVRFTSQKAMVLRSNTTHVHGDEPGVGKGVKSGTVGDISEPIGHASQVRAEGSNVIRHLDRFYMNKRNTVGEAIFVRDVKTYEAPLDDDPIWGSLGSEIAEKPVQLAFDSSTPEGKRLLAEFMKSQKPPVETGPPKPPVRKPSRLGTFGKVLGRAGRVLGPLSTILNGGSPPGFDEAILANIGATKALAGINPAGAVEKGLYDATHGRIEKHIFDNYMDPFSSPDEEYIAEERRYLERKIKEQRETKTLTDTDSDVRVDEEEKKWPCLVGPHNQVSKVCPGEAHHIVPDMALRYGDRPTGITGGDRIPNAPSFAQGMTVCLTPEMHRIGQGGLHSSLNAELKTLGASHVPQGTAPIAKILQKSMASIDDIKGLSDECKKRAKLAAAGQMAPLLKQPGRTTVSLPSPQAVQVLKLGYY
jgi:Domain of unknown function (DUF4150)